MSVSGPEQELDRHFRQQVSALPSRRTEVAVDLDRPIRAGTKLTGRQATALFDAMLASRHLDLAARYLRREGPGLYTIGSAGHESNALVAKAVRASDPATVPPAIDESRTTSIDRPAMCEASNAISRN